MKKIFIVFFLFCLHVSIVFADDQPALEKVSVQLHWKYQFEFAGFIAAKEKGFYRDAGLDVDLKEYNYGTDIVDDILEKRATYGVYNSDILIDYLHQKPLVLLASYFKRSALILITKSYIRTPKDLVGKTIMASGKKDFELNFKPLFDFYKISTNKIHFVKHTYNMLDFINNPKIDAMTAFISDQPYQLDELHYKYNIINPSDYGTFNLQLELFTSQDEIENHRDRALKFRDATNKGWEYALSHEDEIIDIIRKKYSNVKSKDSLQHEAKAIVKLILPYTYSIGSIDKNFLTRQLELVKLAYHIDNNTSIDNFLIPQSNTNRLELTQEEQDYLKTHPNINLCLQYNLFPYDGYVNHKYIGIMSEIYRIIASDLGIHINPIPSVSSPELFLKLQSKECDLLSVMATQSHFFPDVKATKPFIQSYFALVSKLDKSFNQDMISLKDKKLVVQFDAYKNFLLVHYPYLHVEVESNSAEMVKKVLDGEYYSIVAINEKADYLINKYGYGKLKINGFIAKDQPIFGSIGVQESEPILYNILQKELSRIPAEKIENIKNSWRLTRYQERTNYALVFETLALLGFIISLMAYYQRKLKRFNNKLAEQVEIKTKELQEINDSLEKSVQLKVEELIQKDKILTVQSKQAVMGEMISMIAHQWRQPLSTITLQISNLQIKQLLGEISDAKEHEETLTKISDTIVYLSDTIDDFQTYFRPDRKRVYTEIYELIEKALSFIEARIQAKKITIAVQQETKVYLDVYANELIQVILNLLNNAIDVLEVMPIEEKIISLHVSQSKEMVSIYVRDNGTGIDEGNLDKLFEPYFSTKGKNGTGLGLYMSKMIINKQFSGEIEVQSSSKGTAFIIKLPRV